MKQYSDTKNSEIEWIGEIPFEWNIKKLKFSVTNQTIKSKNFDLPYVGLENVESETGLLINFNNEMEESDAKIFHKGDVLFGTLRPYLAKVTKMIFDGRCSGEFLVLQSKEYDGNFLKYLLLSDGTIKNIDASTFGAKMPRAGWSFIGNMKLPIFDIKTQIQLSLFLDKLTMKIFDEIKKYEKFLKLLKEKKQSIISQTITKGLDPTVPMDDSIEWIGNMPKHWKTTRNKFIFKILKNVVGDHSNEYQLLSMGKDGVNIRDIDSGKGKFPESFDSYQSIEPEDLIFCLFDIDETPRTVGLSALSGMITSAYDIVKCFPEVDPKFIYYFYLSIDYRKGLRPFYTGLRKVVKPGVFLGLKTKIPLLPEQKLIVKFLDQEIIKIDELIFQIHSQIQKLKEIHNTMISHVSLGKIDVRQQR